MYISLNNKLYDNPTFRDITVYGINEREISSPSALLRLDAAYYGYIKTEVGMNYKHSWLDTNSQNLESWVSDTKLEDIIDWIHHSQGGGA